MSEERLTVSELLARSGKQDEAAPSRRRRRSVEEGGVSVAELTGSIPRVQARPATSKHHTGSWSSEEVRAAAQNQAASASPAAPAATNAKVVGQGRATTAQQVPNPKATKSATAAAPKVPTQATKVVGRPDQTKKPTAATKIENPNRASNAERPSDDETIVLHVVDENDPIRLTTGDFPQIQSTATGSFRAQEIAPKRAGAPTVVTPPARQSAAAQPVTGRPVPQAAAQSQAMPAAPHTQAPQAFMPPASAASVAPQAPVRPGTQDAHGKGAFQESQREESSAFFDDEELEEVTADNPADEASLNMASIVLMALVGIAFGAAIFVGFIELWERFRALWVAIAAGVVTLGTVWAMHLLRTDHDKRSMIIGGCTALVLTFGPMFLV
ncbi:MAG: hypothetical protein Q3976_02560 [Corynebacterium sp.]|nr:hypothetical protein [Corynebacterium sp.]